MKYGLRLRSFFAILILLVFITISADAFQLNELPTIAWELKYGDADYSYHNRAVALSPKDSGLFIAGEYTSSARGVPTVMEGLWIWKVNPAGEKIINLKLKNPVDDAKKYLNVEALCPVRPSVRGFLLLFRCDS